jgi:indolepyruvate ferredoxin oxidoreductase
MRVAAQPDDIHAIRAGVGNADLILGCDLVVTASNKVLETIRPDHTAVVYSPHETNVAMFTLNANYKLPGGALAKSIEERTRKGVLAPIDSQHYAVKLFGDSIASNMFILGFAVQLGHVPIGPEAIEQAIELNGAAVNMSKNAFRMGRLAAHDKAAVDKLVSNMAAPAAPVVLETFESVLAHRMALLTDYQDATYAQRYETTLRRIAEVEKSRTPGKTTLAIAAAKGLYKLMAYKDEYEVGRLYSSPSFKAQLDAQFSEYRTLEFHLAPPLLARRDKATGEPRKVRFGRWMLTAFGWLAKGKGLRGGTFDVFGYTAERRHERQMIAEYEGVLGEIAVRLSPANHATAVALASLALDIKGFGHVKAKNYEATREREAKLLAALRDPAPSAPLRQAAE